MASLVTDTIFAADPSAHVFNDRVYVYVSYDEPYTNSYDSMVCYHSFSSDDLVNWVDHGRILHLDQVDWAVSHMWAIDGNYWQGKYYLTFCAIERATSTFKTGLAVSDRPEGPFTNLGTIEGVEWGQDPSLFIDEGKPYLVWGGRGAILIGELNQDLRSIKPETIRNLSEQIGGYEGPFLHRREDKYYLTYPALDNEQWPQRMCHAVADNPLGPYTDLGVFIDEYPGNSGTIHGSVFEFRGEWYSFYHSGWVSGTQTSRSLMLDKVEYGADGRILPIAPKPAAAGRDKVEGYSTQVVLDAAAAPLAGGNLHGTRVATGSQSSGAGYVTGLTQQEFGVSVLFHVGPPREYQVWVRYRAEKDTNARVIAGRHLFYDGNQNQDYNQYINRGTLFPGTLGSAGVEWQELLIGTHAFEFGDHQVRLSNSHNLPAGETGLEIDSFRFVPIG